MPSDLILFVIGKWKWKGEGAGEAGGHPVALRLQARVGNGPSAAGFNNPKASGRPASERGRRLGKERRWG